VYRSQKKGKESIYTKLGGEVSIEKIVTIFYNKVIQNAILKEYFINVDMNKLRHMVRGFLTYALGGPNK
jgi:hemoglobin